MMKILIQPIQVYALWREDGTVLPLAFCLSEAGEKQRIAIAEVRGHHEERLAGRRILYFDCLIQTGNRERMVCLGYDIAEHRWYLHKA